MDLDFTVVLAQLFLLLWSNILVTEEYHAPLCNEECQFVSLLIGEILKLKTFNLSPDVAGQMSNFGSGREKCIL